MHPSEYYLLEHPKLRGNSHMYLRIHAVLNTYASWLRLLLNREGELTKLANRMEQVYDDGELRELTPNERAQILQT